MRGIPSGGIGGSTSVLTEWLYGTRFEDLTTNPEAELTNIMKFLLNVTDITGTNAERRVKEVIAKGKDATVLY
jgi:hypothetical protein